MTSAKLRMRFLTTSRGLAITGVVMLMLGISLAMTAHAQSGDEPAPTHFVSIFDSTVKAPAATAELDATVEASPSPSPTLIQPAAATVVTPVPQVTRYTSIFDSAGQTAPTSPAPAPTSASNTEAATPAPQVTRFTSIFDSAAAGSAAESPTPAQGPTRITSIFDSQPASQSTTTGAQGAGGAQQPTPYVSVFDQQQGSVVRYKGDEQPPAEYCLGCHASPYLQMSLPDGEVISVTVDEEAYQESVHGQHGTEGYRCVRCHVGMNEYPHAEVTAQTSRELVIELSTACARCHTDKYDETRDDLHVTLLARGVENAATCADCHTAHEVERLTDETTGAPLPGSAATSAQMCSGCHAEIYATYSESVHGKSVLSGNNDAAACADCHGVHDTKGPSTSPFLLFSPQTCARCHADETLMAKYDISTAVFDTYVADFHGTTVSMFQATSPDQPFNAPVCADCHGVHNITTVSDANSPVLKENLVETCRRCHPNATANFSSAWMSHYPPSFERTPIVAVANLAYIVAIPAVVGGLALFVVADVRRRHSKRDKER